MTHYEIKNKKALIYGAGSVGQVASGTLDRAGMIIAAYIDRRADVIWEHNGKPVFHPDQLKSKITGKDNYVILITIRNVFEHSSLAAHFASAGFKNIIYKPLSILRGGGNEAAESINAVYEAITGHFTVPEQCACYEEEPFRFHDFALQEESAEELLVKLPAELLFSNTNPRIPVWSCRNFYADYIAVDLYAAFHHSGSGMTEQIERYINRFALPGARTMEVNTEGNWRELLIESRQKVYYEMEYKLCMDYDFFVKNCVKVRPRSGGGFELVTSGKNRVSFLIAKGMRYIPVKIDRTAYASYLHLDTVNKMIAYYQSSHPTVFAGIPHPFFYRLDVTAPDYAVKIVKPLARFLAEQIYLENERYAYERYTLSIGINDEGYMGRFFRMLGYQVQRTVTQNVELCALLDELFYYAADDFITDGSASYCSILSDDMPENIIQQAAETTEKFLIWITGFASGPAGLQLQEQHLVRRKELMETIWSGKRICAYLYEK